MLDTTTAKSNRSTKFTSEFSSRPVSVWKPQLESAPEPKPKPTVSNKPAGIASVTKPDFGIHVLRGASHGKVRAVSLDGPGRRVDRGDTGSTRRHGTMLAMRRPLTEIGSCSSTFHVRHWVERRILRSEHERRIRTLSYAEVSTLYHHIPRFAHISAWPLTRDIRHAWRWCGC